MPTHAYQTWLKETGRILPATSTLAQVLYQARTEKETQGSGYGYWSLKTAAEAEIHYVDGKDGLVADNDGKVGEVTLGAARAGTAVPLGIVHGKARCAGKTLHVDGKCEDRVAVQADASAGRDFQGRSGILQEVSTCLQQLTLQLLCFHPLDVLGASAPRRDSLSS